MKATLEEFEWWKDKCIKLLDLMPHSLSDEELKRGVEFIANGPPHYDCSVLNDQRVRPI